jgi:hypothetical protein
MMETGFVLLTDVVSTFLDEGALSLLDEREKGPDLCGRGKVPEAARGVWENIVDQQRGRGCSGLRQMMRVHQTSDSVRPLLEGAIAELAN